MDMRQETDTLVERLRAVFRWRNGDARMEGWWAHAEVLAGLGRALARLHPHAHPSVVIAPEARTARRIVEDSGASWIGAAAIVDATDGRSHPDLRLRALLRVRELY